MNSFLIKDYFIEYEKCFIDLGLNHMLGSFMKEAEQAFYGAVGQLTVIVSEVEESHGEDGFKILDSLVGESIHFRLPASLVPSKYTLEGQYSFYLKRVGLDNGLNEFQRETLKQAFREGFSACFKMFTNLPESEEEGAKIFEYLQKQVSEFFQVQTENYQAKRN